MSKVYLVKFTVEVCEEIEADSAEEAEQAFSEQFGSAYELTEDYGQYSVECISEEEYDGQPDEMQEWHDFDPDC